MIESSSILPASQANKGFTMENNIHITVTPAPLHAEVTDTIPSNLYKPKTPFAATLIVNKKLNHPDSPHDVHHITFDLSQAQDPAFTYLAGQSIGILPPGMDAQGKPHKLRLYSIASPAVGEEGMAQSVSLCVKRLVYNTPEANEPISGVCSNYLCSLPEGATVELTGPVGKSFLLPNQPNANLIMVGTGTGIAPFRAFLKTRYTAENAKQTGQTHLFFGAQTHQDYLYENELVAYQTHQPDTFHLHTAFSREEKTAAGERMYVQHRIFEQRDVVLKLLQQPNTTFYICGLKGMETGIFEAMQQACQEHGVDWSTLLAQLKAEHRWHVEVY